MVQHLSLQIHSTWVCSMYVLTFEKSQSHHSTYGLTWMRLSLEMASRFSQKKHSVKISESTLPPWKVIPTSVAWHPPGRRRPHRFLPAFQRASGPLASSTVGWRHHRGRCQGWWRGSHNCQCSTTCCPTIKLDMDLPSLMAKFQHNIRHFKGRWWWRQDRNLGRFGKGMFDFLWMGNAHLQHLGSESYGWATTPRWHQMPSFFQIYCWTLTVLDWDCLPNGLQSCIFQSSGPFWQAQVVQRVGPQMFRK